MSPTPSNSHKKKERFKFVVVNQDQKLQITAAVSQANRTGVTPFFLNQHQRVFDLSKKYNIYAHEM